MRVESFMRQGAALVPVEIELSLVPGLPQFIFLGLPDAAIKESVIRIRSALRQQGFRLPKAKQVLVQLKPHHVRKTSQGLDLAVAAAYLWETGQIARSTEALPCLYGALSLSGLIEAPGDISGVEVNDSRVVWTAKLTENLPFMSLQFSALRDLCRVWPAPIASGTQTPIRRPQPAACFHAPSAAELAALIAAGEHSALITGAPGSGKTTFVDSIAAWVERQVAWRPVVKPHHTITPLAMLGGGAQIWAGQIAKADRGILVLDELLEFHPKIQDGLREPAETGNISVARGGRSQEFLARFLMLATSNLCGCGKFSPFARLNQCRCRRAVRQRFLERLSGPFADRFALSADSSGWLSEKRRISSEQIATRVERAIEFRLARGQTEPNSRLDADVIEAGLSGFQRQNFLSGLERTSMRRRVAMLRVSRTLADLRLDSLIADCDLQQALLYCVHHQRRLEEGRDT